MTQTLDSAKEREVALKEEIKGNEALLTRAAVTQNTFREMVELWTEGLVNIATVIEEELAQLGVEGFGYSSDENLQPSVKLTLFFKGVATALQQLRQRIPKQLSDESRTICARVLEKVLVKVAFRECWAFSWVGPLWSVESCGPLAGSAHYGPQNLVGL